MTMRTSVSQFEVMVEFMERNGDLNKPAGGPHGRLSNFAKWEKLVKVLNLDPTGGSKPVDKWKKVWSDLKTNTKKKAAKLNRAASGTGGGPALKICLSNLEERVLSLMGPEAATGMVSVNETVPVPQNDPARTGIFLESEVPPPVLQPRSPTPTQLPANLLDIGELMVPGGSGQSTPFPTEVVEVTTASPTTSHVLQIGTPTRPRPRRVIRVTPERRSRVRVRTHGPRADAAAHQFVQSDSLWRDLATKFVTESLRQRDAELQMQAQWQTLFAKYLELLDKKLNK